jgi:hypothetical protein
MQVEQDEDFSTVVVDFGAVTTANMTLTWPIDELKQLYLLGVLSNNCSTSLVRVKMTHPTLHFRQAVTNQAAGDAVLLPVNDAANSLYTDFAAKRPLLDPSRVRLTRGVTDIALSVTGADLAAVTFTRLVLFMGATRYKRAITQGVKKGQQEDDDDDDELPQRQNRAMPVTTTRRAREAMSMW